MYPIEIKIPDVGEASSFPSFEGVGVQVVSLNFKGSNNPTNNPTILSSSRRLNARMTTGDPLRVPFDGLRVQNQNPFAAGTLALLRVYEEGDPISPVPKPSQSQVRSGSNLKVIDINDTWTLDETAGGHENDDPPNRLDILPKNEEYARYIPGVTLKLWDNTITAGFPVTAYVILKGEGIDGVARARNYNVRKGMEERYTLFEDLLVPKGVGIHAHINADASSANAGGEFRAFLDGYAYYDKNAEVPPF